jgi:hypothetical protein
MAEVRTAFRRLGFAASQCVTSAGEASFIRVEGHRTGGPGGTDDHTRGRNR